MGAPDCFGDTAPVHWVGYSLPTAFALHQHMEKNNTTVRAGGRGALGGSRALALWAGLLPFCSWPCGLFCTWQAVAFLWKGKSECYPFAQSQIQNPYSVSCSVPSMPYFHLPASIHFSPSPHSSLCSSLSGCLSVLSSWDTSAQAFITWFIPGLLQGLCSDFLFSMRPPWPVPSCNISQHPQQVFLWFSAMVSSYLSLPEIQLVKNTSISIIMIISGVTYNNNKSKIYGGRNFRVLFTALPQ